MKILYKNYPKTTIHLEAETDEEAVFLHKFFTEDLKKVAEKFPLIDKNWGVKKEE